MPSKDNKTSQPDSPFLFGQDAVGAAGAAVPGQGEAAAKAEGRAEGKAGAKKWGKRKSEHDAGEDLPAQEAQAAALFDFGRGQDAAVPGADPDVVAYTQQMGQRHAMDRRLRILLIAAVLLVVLIPVLTVMPIALFGAGKNAITPALLGEYIGTNVTGLANWITGGPVTSGISVLFMQTLAVVFVGAALSVNGCIFQGTLKNALAAPSTLGVTSGATLGTLVWSLTAGMSGAAAGEVVVITQASEVQAQYDAMNIFQYILLTQQRALCSLLGCFIVVGLVLLIAHIAGRGKVSKVGLLVAGQVFAALIAGVISVIRTYILYYGDEDQLAVLRNVVGGSLSDIVGWVSLLSLVIPITIGLIIVLRLRFRLNLLAFNDEEAKSMGISTTFTRNALIIVCTALTGLCISFVGAVGFVGFLVPHMARKIIGPDFRYLVPASMLFGSIFLLLANYLMNLTGLFQGSLGTLTSLLGIVFFIVVIVRERARGNVDWL